MRTAHVIVTAFFAIGCFSAGYVIGGSRTITGQELGDRERLGSKAQVEDAMRRWSVKANEPVDRVKKIWNPRSMFIPTRNQGLGMTCIQLRIERGAVGGEPVYCYKDNTTTLVAEYSDVE